MQAAGKLLLLSEPLQYNGQNLEVTEELPEGLGKRWTGPPPKTGGIDTFVPRGAVSKPRTGLGSSKSVMRRTAKQPDTNESNLASSSTQAIVGKGQDDFRRMLG